MNRKRRERLVDKVLLGDASEEESSALVEQMRVDPQLRMDVEDVEFLLNNIYPRPYMDEFDTSYYAGLRRIEYQFNSLQARRRGFRVAGKFLLGCLSTCAVIFLVVVFFTTPYVSSASNGDSQFSLAYQRLPDNTVVTLSKDATYTFLHYPFGRSLTLSGDARLQIPIDSLRPFYLRAGLGSIRTWGGEMFVRIFPGEFVRIYLMSGELEIGEGQTKATLRSGENAIIVPTGKVVKTTLNDEDYDFWYTGKMTFEAKRLDNVINRIENNYNVIIRAEGLKVSDLKFTGVIQRMGSVEEVLNAICVELNLKYYEDGLGIYVLMDAAKDPLIAF